MGCKLFMKKALLFISIAVVIIFSGCSVLFPKEAEVDYKMLEQTAMIRITQTFEAMPTATPTFTPLPTNTPEPTATDTPAPTPTEEEVFLIERSEAQASPTPVPPTPTVYFPDKADFTAALPSPNQFLPGQHFMLTWQLKNVGTSTWSGKYTFRYSEGVQLADQNEFTISDVIEPGGILTVTMPATAPTAEGTYQTTWVLTNPEGIPFYWVSYVTIVGDKTFITAEPALNPTATPDSLAWMCSDPERSRIQGDGCLDYCSPEVAAQMEAAGTGCYANGESVSYDD